MSRIELFDGNKESQLCNSLEEAAFRAVMLALAASQSNADPGQRSTLLEGKRLSAEFQWGNPAEQKAKKPRRH
jgi:hypothetical protein